jgi:hypothetical protein
MTPMGYSGVQSKLIHERNLKLKISCQTPYKLPFASIKLYIVRDADSCGHSLPGL